MSITQHTSFIALFLYRTNWIFCCCNHGLALKSVFHSPTKGSIAQNVRPCMYCIELNILAVKPFYTLLCIQQGLLYTVHCTYELYSTCIITLSPHLPLGNMFYMYICLKLQGTLYC